MGIEGGQDTSLDTLPVALGDECIGSFSVDELLQGTGGLEELFFARRYPLARLLFQDDEIAADLGSCVL